MPTSTISIENSTVNATSLNGAGIGTSPVWNSGYYKPQNVDVTISGSSKVVARSVNGAGIGGGMLKQTIKDPDAVVINPSIGGWEDASGGSISTYSLRRSVSAVTDSAIPSSVQKYVHSDGQTLTVKTTNAGTPTILAESGVCAISSKTVTTDTTIIQNTVKTAPTQTMPVKVNGTLLADLHKSYKSVARTANAGTVTDGTSVSFEAINAGTYGMTYGSGDDPDPLINWNEAVTPLYGSTFSIVENKINRFWTMPQEKLGGSAVVATGSVTGTSVTETVKNTEIYAKISGLTPKAAQTSNMLTYQWYKNGTEISDATGTSYTPTEVGLYHYVVTGTQLYRGSITSSMVTVKADESATVPDAPEAEAITKNSITLKASTDSNTYEYSIDGGQTWQSEVTFSNLTPQTTYNIVQRVKVESGDNDNPISQPLTVATLNDLPDAATILALIDYEKENLTSLPDGVNFYSDAECKTQIRNLTDENGLTAYIAAYGENPKYIYARFASVEGTGNDKVTSVEIPARPAAPTLTSENISAGTTSITVIGTNGVSYTCNNTTQVYADSALTFTGLNENTGYTVYAQLSASNEEKRFSSAKSSLAVTTKKTGELSTTILIPSGTTTAMTYDLSDVISAAGSYTLPTSLTSGDTSVVSAVSVSGNSVTITPASGQTGTATITGTNTSITVKIVDVVGQSSDGKILWLWKQAETDTATDTKFREAAVAHMTVGYAIDEGAIRQLTPVYAYGVSVGTRVTETISATVSLPYWTATDTKTPYMLIYQNPSTSEISRISPLTQGVNVVQVTRTQDDYGLYGLYALETTSTTLQIKTEVTPFTDANIPQSLKNAGYDTVEKIETQLKTVVADIDGFTGDNTALYDVTLYYSTDGGVTWIKANETHFPVDGRLLVSIPAPDGSDPSIHDYVGVHMFTSNAFGKTVGGTEQVDFTERSSDGTVYLDGYVTGLSPILVSWRTAYTITFDANGGNVSPSSATTKADGTLASLPTPTRSGYTFNGWYTAANGGEKITTSTEFTENTTIFAQWTQNQTPSTGGGGGVTYAITVEKAENGEVKANRNYASRGSTVTITTTPEDGYVLKELSVTDSQGNNIEWTDKGDGTYTFKMPRSKVTVVASFTATKTEDAKCDGGADCPSAKFVDLDTNAWYHEAVDYALIKGMMSGYGNGYFGPNDVLTRGMLAHILYNLEGRPAVSGEMPFTDVAEGRYYYNAIQWAAGNGIVVGYGGGLYGPDDNITRQQLATMIWRYAGSPAATNKELDFTDADQASSWAIDALIWAQENGIMQGNNGEVNPRGSATRAHVAQMLKNFIENIVNN